MTTFKIFNCKQNKKKLKENFPDNHGHNMFAIFDILPTSKTMRDY